MKNKKTNNKDYSETKDNSATIDSSDTNQGQNEEAKTRGKSAIKAVIFSVLALALLLVPFFSSLTSTNQNIATPTPTPSFTPTSEETFHRTDESPPSTKAADTITTIPNNSPTDTTIPQNTERPTTNLFDGQLENGGLDINGEEVATEQLLRTGFIMVEPNTVYTLSTEEVSYPFTTSNVIEYDENKNYICKSVNGYRVDPATFVTRENTRYIRWYTDNIQDINTETLEKDVYWLEEGKISTPWTRIKNGLVADKPKNQGVKNMLDRLAIFCDTTLVTSGNGMVIGYQNPHKAGQADPYNEIKLNEGSRILGFPYSSVRKTDSYVGFEISLDTYLSSISNPASIMYTRNYQAPSDPDYSPFIQYVWNPYGNVCSTMLGYALDLDVRYSTYEWEEIESMKKIDPQTDGIQLGDVLCNVTVNDISGGHLAMVTDILRDENGEIVYIRITEAGVPTMMHSYVYYNYFKSVHLNEFSLYRYQNLSDIPEVDSKYVCKPESINKLIALDRGDMSNYTIGSSVEVNLMDESISSLTVEFFSSSENEYKTLFVCEGSDWQNRTINQRNFTIYSFTPEKCGDYRVFSTQNDGKTSDYLYFSVVDSGKLYIANSINIVPVNKSFDVVFSDYSGCTPLYICVETDKYVTRVQRMLTDSEIKNGNASISCHIPGNSYVKIYYQNQYGRVCSERVALKVT